MGNINSSISNGGTDIDDVVIPRSEVYIPSSKILKKNSRTPYIFSPDKWTILEPNMETKNWTDLNIKSNLNMYIQLDIIITSSNTNYRNIFNFKNNNNEISRIPGLWIDNKTLFGWFNFSTPTNVYNGIQTPIFTLNTPTNIVFTIVNGSLNIYFNSVLMSTTDIGNDLIEANDETELIISEPGPTDDGILIKNLTFGNLTDSIKCSQGNICVGLEPDNQAYCYGSKEYCLWSTNQCTTNQQCQTQFNITSPKYKFVGGGENYNSSKDYCSPTSSINDWPSWACPDVYKKLKNESCNYKMSPAEVQCYRNNNPDLKKLNDQQLQENWYTSGCIEQRNNQCPSYQQSSGLYNFIGCYNDMCYNGDDSDPRALPNFRGNVKSVDECQSIAEANNETLFGVQFGTGLSDGNTQCFTGSYYDAAVQYGLNVNKNKCAPLGSWCTQQIYQRSKPFPPPTPPIPVLQKSNFSEKIEQFTNPNSEYNEKNNMNEIYIIILFFIIICFILIYYIFYKVKLSKKIKFNK